MGNSQSLRRSAPRTDDSQSSINKNPGADICTRGQAKEAEGGVVEVTRDVAHIFENY